MWKVKFRHILMVHWRLEVWPADPMATLRPKLCTVGGGGTVVGFKLSGHFKFFFDIINVRVTFLDAKGPIK